MFIPRFDLGVNKTLHRIHQCRYTASPGHNRRKAYTGWYLWICRSSQTFWNSLLSKFQPCSGKILNGYPKLKKNSFIAVRTVISAVWIGKGTLPFGENVNHHEYVFIVLRFQHAREGLRILGGPFPWDYQLCSS